MQELLDVVNEQDEVVGQIDRKELEKDVHAIVRLVGVQVYSKGRALLQQRKFTKKLYPGHWTLSATGHVQAGEAYPDAATRELQEEVGIQGAIRLVRRQLLEYDGVRRMWAFFDCESHESPTMQADEIEEIRYTDLRNPEEFLSAGNITPSLRFYLQALMNIRDGSDSSCADPN